ncbi:MAG: hypothetical protein K8S94_06170 [Planctomycetia bacterium]|nr:hypothetical protein [Planctomycetia bacterium]
MRNRSLSCGSHVALLVSLVLGAPCAGRAAETVIWRDATPAAPLDHSVMVRSLFLPSHVRVHLDGPRALVMPAPAADDTGTFNAYRITTVADEEPRVVGVAIDATKLEDVRLGPAEFLLVPTRRLTDGAPQPTAEHVYEARPILGEPLLDGVAAAAGQNIGQPTHLCLPVDYKHHFERVKIRDAARGLVLFSPSTATEEAAVSVVDDFGTNRLVPGTTSRAGVWVVVRAGAAP